VEFLLFLTRKLYESKWFTLRLIYLEKSLIYQSEKRMNEPRAGFVTVRKGQMLTSAKN
jgi:hypothetical protein